MFPSFLSYARLDAKNNPFFNDFFDRLTGLLSRWLNHDAETVCFRDDQSLDLGERWTPSLTQALLSSQL